MWHWFAHLDLNTLLLILLGILTAWREGRAHRWENQDRIMRAQAKAERDDISAKIDANTEVTAAVGAQVAESHGKSLEGLIKGYQGQLSALLDRKRREADSAETEARAGRAG